METILIKEEQVDVADSDSIINTNESLQSTLPTIFSEKNRITKQENDNTFVQNEDKFDKFDIKSEIREDSINMAISTDYEDDKNEKLYNSYSQNTEILVKPSIKEELSEIHKFSLNRECLNSYENKSNQLSLSIGKFQPITNKKLDVDSVEEYTVPISFSCQKIQTNEKTIDGSVVKKIFESKEIPMVKLYKTEIYKKNYACAICYDIFYNVKALMKHSLKHNIGGVINDTFSYEKKHQNIKCMECNFVSQYTSYMHIHQMRHQEIKPYKCDICNYRTSKLGYFKAHVKIHSGIKPHKCDICNYRCITMIHLKTHKKTHTDEKPFHCDECNFKSRHSNSLKSHMMIHTGQKPFKCQICDYSCISSGYLKIHKMSHTGERPFACDVCSYRSVTSSVLKRHKMTHLGIKPAICDICQHKSSSLTTLKMHKMVHSDVKPYACNFCDFTCKSSGSMKRHKKRHISNHAESERLT